jgi:hypothetical protein
VLAFAALLVGCTDPIGVRPVPADRGSEPPPEPAPTCEDVHDIARRWAYHQGLHEFCYTPSAPMRVWGPLTPRDEVECTCRGTVS